MKLPDEVSGQIYYLETSLAAVGAITSNVSWPG